MMYICFYAVFYLFILFYMNALCFNQKLCIFLLNNKKKEMNQSPVVLIYIYKFLTCNWSYLKLCGEDKPHLSA